MTVKLQSSRDFPASKAGPAADRRRPAKARIVSGAKLACWLAAFLLLPHAPAQDSFIDRIEADIDAESEAICEPLPGEPTLSERLEGALRFAIDPAPSAGPLQELAEHQPGQLVAAMLALSLNGESWQKWDLAMFRFTAPPEPDQAEMVRLMEAVTGYDSAEGRVAMDLDGMWQRFHEIHPMGGEKVNPDWACLRAEPRDEKTIRAVLGYGLEACGVLERADSLDEAEALAASHGWSSLLLKRLGGREASIANTDLTAALYAIDELRFHD